MNPAEIACAHLNKEEAIIYFKGGSAEIAINHATYVELIDKLDEHGYII